MIVIRYAVPPEIIVFSIDEATYILEYKKDVPRTPYTVIEIGGIGGKITNINEWIAQKTNARYNLELLHDLANAFIMGRESSYHLTDLQECADEIFSHARNMLFRDGLAGRYAELHDIECMSLNDIKHELGTAHSAHISQDRVRRFLRVCQKNGWSDLADGWLKFLKEPFERPNPVIDQIGAPIVDDTIRRSIKRLVASTYTKDKDYVDIINVLQEQHTSRGIDV